MTEEKHKYLVKNKCYDLYLSNSEEPSYFTALFSNCVLDKVPEYVDSEDPCLEIIRSDTQKFKDLTKHLDLE